MNISFPTKKMLILGAICVLTYLCFSYTQYNQFTNWDDDFYVTNDPYIKAFTPENLQAIFTKDITKNNYHPLCMLSLAVNYHFSKLDPRAYYLTNVFIHIGNVILVFFLLLAICSRLKMDDNSRLFIASFGALWFGVHPMHVESVSWIAERKDVLYAFFYFGGLLCYLRYLNGNKMKWYWLTYALFVLSCLSKPMAVVFPFSLLCIDVLFKRPLSKRLIFEKIIFFVSSLICGGAAFYTQNKTGAIASFSTLTLAERFMYASYGFVMYVWKLFNPTYLSTFYPYPFRYITGWLPTIFYAAPFISVCILAIPLLFYKWKEKRVYFPIAAFGIGYFFVNVMFILQFISVGAAIMADRYSYVAYFGLLFLLGYLLNMLRLRFPSFRTALVVVLLCLSGGLAYGCYQRTLVWHDSESLLSDAIDKYPIHKDPDKYYDRNLGVAMLSYKWRGNYYFYKGDYDRALADYNVLVMLRSADDKVREKVAIINSLKNTAQPAAPLPDGQKKDYKAAAGSALAYIMAGDTVNAFKDYVAAYGAGNIKAEQIISDSGFNFVQRQKFAPAVLIYNMLLKINTRNPYYYFYRGVALYSLDHVEAAIADWEISVKFDNKDTRKSGSNNLSVAYDAIGKDSLALYYVQMAIATGNNVKPDFVDSIKKRAREQRRR